MGEHHPTTLDGESISEPLAGGLLAARAADAAGVALDADTYDALASLDAHLDRIPDTRTVSERLCVAITGDNSNKPWAAIHRYVGSVDAILTDADAVIAVADDLADDAAVFAVRSRVEGVAAVSSVAGNSLKGFKGEDQLCDLGGFVTGTMADEDNKIDLWHADEISIQAKVNGGSDKRWENQAQHKDVDYLIVIDAETGGIGVNECDPDFDGKAAYLKARDAGAA